MLACFFLSFLLIYFSFLLLLQIRPHKDSINEPLKEVPEVEALQEEEVEVEPEEELPEEEAVVVEVEVEEALFAEEETLNREGEEERVDVEDLPKEEEVLRVEEELPHNNNSNKEEVEEEVPNKVEAVSRDDT